VVPKSHFVCKYGVDLLSLTLFHQLNSSRIWLTSSTLLPAQAMLNLTRQTKMMKAVDFRSPGKEACLEEQPFNGSFY